MCRILYNWKLSSHLFFFSFPSFQIVINVQESSHRGRPQQLTQNMQDQFFLWISGKSSFDCNRKRLPYPSQCGWVLFATPTPFPQRLTVSQPSLWPCFVAVCSPADKTEISLMHWVLTRQDGFISHKSSAGSCETTGISACQTQHGSPETLDMAWFGPG